jgi:hypothetical protein
MMVHLRATQFGNAEVTTKQCNRFDRLKLLGLKFILSKNASNMYVYWKSSGMGYTTDVDQAHAWAIVENYPSSTRSRKVLNPIEAIAFIQNQGILNETV